MCAPVAPSYRKHALVVPDRFARPGAVHENSEMPSPLISPNAVSVGLPKIGMVLEIPKSCD